MQGFDSEYFFGMFNVYLLIFIKYDIKVKYYTYACNTLNLNSSRKNFNYNIKML